MISLQNLKYLAPHANTDDASCHEYINLQIINEYTPTNTEPKQIIFNQVKASNIVDITGDYFLSVIRWNLQSNLPVLIPDMILYPANVNHTNFTNYQLALFYTTTNIPPYGPVVFYNNPRAVESQTDTLQYIPETDSYQYEQTLKAPTNIEEVYSNPYYYIKYVDTFCQMINKSIQDFFNGIGGSSSWVHLPYFQWDAQTQKLVFYRPNSVPSGVPGTQSGSQWYLAVNQPLYNLLNTFRFKFFPVGQGQIFSTGAHIYPQNECRYILDTNILTPEATTTIGDYTAYYQQSSSVVNWSPVQSIVFVSSTIPIESQFAGAPANLNVTDGTTQSSIYQQQSVVKVLTDFIIPFNSGTEATNQQVYYIPTGEYRLIDLLGNNNLNQLTIQAFWRDKFGVFHPMTLDAGASADILMMLRKKSYNNQN